MHFFDLDGTLIRGNCSFSFGLFLFKKRKISLFKALSLLCYYAAYQCHMLSMKSLHQACFNKLFKGQLKVEFDSLAAKFVDASFDKLLIFSCTEVKGLKFICSSSPDLLVSLFAKKLKVDDWIATSYDLDEEGRFSKVGFVVDGERKAHFLNQKRILGEKTVAYSDSLDDKLFLEAADQAFLVNQKRWF